MKKFILLIALTLCLSIGNCAAAEDTSFVDNFVYADLLFEEDPDDEFLAEKREINRIYEKNFPLDEATDKLLHTKIDELHAKTLAKYGNDYVDLDRMPAIAKLIILDFDVRFTYRLQDKLADYGTDLAERLKDENLWKTIETTVHNEFKGTGIPLEVNFRLDQKFAEMCKTVLGDNDPVTLRHTINLIRDYGLLGDSKTALSMAKKLLPQVEKVFGNNSREVAELLSFMADDYATLGDYKSSEDTLLKAIDVNKKIHGAESSPELVANLVALAKLTRGAPVTMNALDYAAKNFSEDELYRLGYFRAKLFANPIVDSDSHMDLLDVNAKEEVLADKHSRDYYNKWIDGMLAEADDEKILGYYGFSLAGDLRTLDLCKVYLGSYHHKTLRALCNLSDDYLMLNQTDDALALAQYALVMSQEFYGDDHPCTIRATHSLTNVYRKQGRYGDAYARDYDVFEICKKKFADSSAVEPAEKMTNLADLAADAEGLQRNSSAIKFYEAYLELADVDGTRDAKVADVRKNLARLYNQSGDYAKTVALYDFLRKDNSYSLDGLNVGGLIAAHTADALAEALAAVNKKSAATEVYAQEVTKFEEVRYFNSYSTNETQLGLFAQMVPYYKKAAAFFISQGDDVEAFRRVELCKGRTLADQYGELLAVYKSGVTDVEIKRLNDYRDKISGYRDKFGEELTHGSDALKLNLINTRFKIFRDYRDYRLQLREKYPQYEELAESSWVMTYQAVKNLSDNSAAKLIPPNHCYISFSVAEDKILAFVVNDSGKVKSFAIAVDDKFFDNCRVYHELFEVESFGYSKFLWQLPDGNYKVTTSRERPTADAEFINLAEKFETARQKLSAQLGETLLAPLAGSITAKTWIISPDAELNNVPFETLTLNGGMVIVSKDVCYVPSLAVLQLMKDAGEKNSRLADRKELFGMGNAVYEIQGGSNLRGKSDINRRHDEWINLPGTAEELNTVSNLFQKNLQAVMTGRDASERNLKQLDTSGTLAQYKYLLFAAHGVFDADKPEMSAIVLSQGLNDADFDGYVTIGEWLGYNLNSDLIYLSACESGRGDYQAGEGIIGIPYALTMAGNKDTVMSLWKVRDTATAKFTSAVFEKLSRGQSEVQALNNTKREFLSSGDAELNAPTVWAAFVLYGI